MENYPNDNEDEDNDQLDRESGYGQLTSQFLLSASSFPIRG